MMKKTGKQSDMAAREGVDQRPLFGGIRGDGLELMLGHAGVVLHQHPANPTVIIIRSHVASESGDGPLAMIARQQRLL